ncbi:hypothetical protein N836_31575 [Leptolyngbya sp. Heron Island J]|uniref:hypothetical protein n=1 Tax=Leptolyngbya sp. Heron Island J TaxID=1385935 RepID=UPI0003B9392E|nr:hypothetical protein [Leptolyngbya sp. Heron Island J]ESA38482.1 hypothetical protein N836_31575 [Leptolyngbya sp. Heron Island J]
MNNPFGIKAKAPLSIVARPGEVSLTFNRVCGMQIHHEILSIEIFGNFHVGVQTYDNAPSEPEPSLAYWINFPHNLYDPNHVATRIAERLKAEHGIDSIVSRYNPKDDDNEGPMNVLVTAR